MHLHLKTGGGTTRPYFYDVEFLVTNSFDSFSVDNYEGLLGTLDLTRPPERGPISLVLYPQSVALVRDSMHTCQVLIPPVLS